MSMPRHQAGDRQPPDVVRWSAPLPRHASNPSQRGRGSHRHRTSSSANGARAWFLARRDRLGLCQGEISWLVELRPKKGEAECFCLLGSTPRQRERSREATGCSDKVGMTNSPSTSLAGTTLYTGVLAPTFWLSFEQTTHGSPRLCVTSVLGLVTARHTPTTVTSTKAAKGIAKESPRPRPRPIPWVRFTPPHRSCRNT